MSWSASNWQLASIWHLPILPTKRFWSKYFSKILWNIFWGKVSIFLENFPRFTVLLLSVRFVLVFELSALTAAIRSWIGAVWSQNGRFLHRFPQLLTFKCVFQSQFNCPRNKIASNNPLSICRSCLWHKICFYIVFFNVLGCSVVFMNKRGWLSFENLTLKSTSNSPFCGGGVCPDWLATVVSAKSDPSSFCLEAA